VSAGIDPLSESGGAYVRAQGAAGALSFDASGQALFSAEGFTQSVVKATLATALAGLNSRLTFSHNLSWFYGYQDALPLTNTVQYTFSMDFSTVRARGGGYHNYGGMHIMPFFLSGYWQSLDDVYLNPGVQVSAYFPRLLPFTNPSYLTLNQPFSLQAALFPSRTAFLQVSAQVVPFSLELQKGIPFLTVFIRRITLTASYSGAFVHTNYSWDIEHTFDIAKEALPYRDSVTLSLFATSGINTGVLTSVAAELGADLVYDLRPAPGGQPWSIRFYGRLVN
jgi:hypothetical protein